MYMELKPSKVSVSMHVTIVEMQLKTFSLHACDHCGDIAENFLKYQFSCI